MMVAHRAYREAGLPLVESLTNSDAFAADVPALRSLVEFSGELPQFVCLLPSNMSLVAPRWGLYDGADLVATPRRHGDGHHERGPVNGQGELLICRT